MLKYVYLLYIYFRGLRYVHITGQLQWKMETEEPKLTAYAYSCRRPGIPSFPYIFRTDKIERCPYMKCSWIFLET